MSHLFQPERSSQNRNVEVFEFASAREVKNDRCGRTEQSQNRSQNRIDNLLNVNIWNQVDTEPRKVVDQAQNKTKSKEGAHVAGHQFLTSLHGGATTEAFNDNDLTGQSEPKSENDSGNNTKHESDNDYDTDHNRRQDQRPQSRKSRSVALTDGAGLAHIFFADCMNNGSLSDWHSQNHHQQKDAQSHEQWHHCGHSLVRVLRRSSVNTADHDGSYQSKNDHHWQLKNQDDAKEQAKVVFDNIDRVVQNFPK